MAYKVTTSGISSVFLSAQQSSDIILVYGGGHTTELLKQLQCKTAKVVFLEAGWGTGSAITGTIAAGGKVSVITSSQGFAHILPIALILANHQQACVFHVVSEEHNIELFSQSSEVPGSNLFTVISSTTPQECAQVASSAQHLSSLTNKPVIHIIDPQSAADLVTVTIPEKSNVVAEKTKDVLDLAKKVGLEFFSYVGPKEATQVVLASEGSAQSYAALESLGLETQVGLVRVRIHSPWLSEELIKSIPSKVEKIFVLERPHSDLGIKVKSSFVSKGKIPEIVSLTLPTDISLESVADVLKPSLKVSDDNLKDLSKHELALAFWDIDRDGTGPAAFAVAKVLPKSDKERWVRLSSKWDRDTFGGITKTELVVSKNGDPTFPIQYDFVACHNVSILKNFDLVSSLKQGGVMLVNTGLELAAFEEQLIPHVRGLVRSKAIRLVLLDATKCMGEAGLIGAETTALQVACLAFSGLAPNTAQCNALISSQENDLGGVSVESVVAFVLGSCLVAPTNRPLLDPVPEEERPTLIKNPSGHLRVPVVKTLNLPYSSLQCADWLILFPKLFKTQISRRPDQTDSHTVKVTLFKTLSPATYDRNLFHVEFDLGDTGLVYKIGDALGVYPRNDRKKVLDFLNAYKLNPEHTVAPDAVPKPLLGRRLVWTVETMFTEVLDLFGRPPKRFYELMAEWSTEHCEKEKLTWLTTKEGQAEFKKRVTATVTFADLLLEFVSVRPPLNTLMQMIPAIKPRHYSISSAMSMYPKSVHLLVVEVSWVTPSGETRYGLCSHYLSQLQEGDEVTVCIKPSVMTLPPNPSTPIIMAGLGTGMAPFRAFLLERAYQRQQGFEVGPVVLYFGSRHRAMEYLYAEELEAYNQDGLLTHLALAFSRDQTEKVYIQHKIAEDSELLTKLLLDQGGRFYLCGPTWPAGDVEDAIQGGFVKSKGMDIGKAKLAIVDLKEEGRYTLEVY